MRVYFQKVARSDTLSTLLFATDLFFIHFFVTSASSEHQQKQNAAIFNASILLRFLRRLGYTPINTVQVTFSWSFYIADV